MEHIYIYSAKPMARIRSIKLMPELQLDGVRDIISSKDIPNGGMNIGAKSKFGTEPLFAEEIARCVGERLAFVIADTQKVADMAANSAIVDYSIENLEPPILCVEDAVERSSFFEVPPFLCPKQVGDVSKGMAEADHKILSAEMKLRSQYYFYMETQTALAVPDEDNCITVYSSSQSPEIVHSTIARCLGIPENNVRVVTRRVGGGFGGKGIKSVAVCRTNHPSRSVMRAPGNVQGSFIAEAIIENVAATLSMDVDSVRSINLHTYTSLKAFYDESCGEPLEYTMPSIWNKLAVSANYDLRVDMVKEFKKINTWKKRGISRIPVMYEVNLRPTPGKASILSDGSIVVEVGGIELGQGLWTKVKQMAAFALSAVQCDGTVGLLDKIRVVQADTVSLIQGGLTAGSITSESSYEAVRLSCNILVERLKPLKKKLQEEMGSVKWDMLILQIEGSFIQGLGFFMLEEYETNLDGLVLADGTWNYKIPTIDTIPQQFYVEILNSEHHQHRVLSSKASGEPPVTKPGNSLFHGAA